MKKKIGTTASSATGSVFSDRRIILSFDGQQVGNTTVS